jgi:hypothetical protein
MERPAPIYSNAHARFSITSSSSSCRIIITLLVLWTLSLLSAKQSTEPRRSLCSFVLDDGIELVGSSVDLLACLVHLTLRAGLGLFILLLRVGAVGIKLLLCPLRFRLSLVSLATVSILSRVTWSHRTYVLLCAGAYCLVTLLAGLLRLLVLARVVAS